MAAADENEAYAAAVRAAEHEHYEALLGGVWSASAEVGQLRSAYRQLVAALQAGGKIPDNVQSALDSTEKAATAIDHMLTACNEHRTEVWKPTEKSAQSAERVFGIPELCEQILTYLVRGQDLLHASQVNRATAAVARGSSSIQHALGFAPDRSGFWQSPFSSRAFVGFQCDVDFQYAHTTQQLPEQPTVKACFVSDSDYYDYTNVGNLPLLGSAFRNLPICSPPVKEMEVRPSCCAHWSKSELGGYWSSPAYVSVWRGHPQPPPPRTTKPLFNPNGITVGDIYDATLSTKEEHHLCPYASSYSHDEEGLVHQRVLFEGAIELAEHDPLMVAMREALAEASRPVEVVSLRTEMDKGDSVLAYMRAKVNAVRTGKSIPTLAEYTASKAFWRALEESETNKEDKHWARSARGDGWDFSEVDWSAADSVRDDDDGWGAQVSSSWGSPTAPANAVQPGVSYAAMASRGL
ncbi:hypothetical protein LTR10_005167 [Elasticomyces elasticus]|nr:hypothetical protein LTR10_005167 [Elasticomyces elasticus]KAK4975906.1 hypothetical protein LTR42_003528 [Elasticomyces elasticus]